jgi:hypothetical protein
MEPKSHFQFIIRVILTIALYFLQQLPAHYLARIDRAMFLASFSMVLDGVRVGGEDWKLGPGWFGDDGEIGKRYDPGPEGQTNTRESTHLAMLYNSDSLTTIPYNNQDRWTGIQQWAAETYAAGETVPTVVAAKHSLGPDADELMAGGRPAKFGALRCVFPTHCVHSLLIFSDVAVGLRAQKGTAFRTPAKKRKQKYSLYSHSYGSVEPGQKPKPKAKGPGKPKAQLRPRKAPTSKPPPQSLPINPTLAHLSLIERPKHAPLLLGTRPYAKTVEVVLPSQKKTIVVLADLAKDDDAWVDDNDNDAETAEVASLVNRGLGVPIADDSETNTASGAGSRTCLIFTKYATIN